MVKNVDVIGSIKNKKDIDIYKTIIYKRFNFRDYLNEDGSVSKDMIIYDEIQYNKEEFLDLLVTENKELTEQLLDTQLMIIENYEDVSKKNEQLLDLQMAIIELNEMKEGE